MSCGRRRSEQGSALIISLVFVTGFSLLVAAILSFADVGLRAGRSYREEARISNAADAAIAAATRRYATTGPCNNFTAPLVEGPGGTATPINGQGVIVRCEGPPPARSKATQPANSLLSLGTSTDPAAPDGIRSTEDLSIVGDVFSRTTVAPTATMVVQQGEVSAIGNCTGPIQTTPYTPNRCANNPDPKMRADPSRGRDPDYTKATTVVPVRREVPSCATVGAAWLVALEPGYYDDAAALSGLTGGGCPGRVVWFKPGTYYLDFTFRDAAAPATWSVNDPTVDVVGGTPTWDTAASSRPAFSVPGSCKTKEDPGLVEGVQLIAGGGSRLQVSRGRMELCAKPSTTDQQIALFGLRPELGTHVLEATDITGQGFSPALNAQTVDEEVHEGCPDAVTPCPLSAKATLKPAPDPDTASLTLSDFRPGVPSGSVIDAIKLRVDHAETGDPVELTFTATWPGATGGCTSPQPLPPGGVLLDIACGLDTSDELAGLAVAVDAKLTTGGAEAHVEVDGVVVEISYRTPTTRKPTTSTPSPDYANHGHAFEIAEQPVPLTADAALSDTGLGSASIELRGLGDPPLPASATVDSAVLRVAHHDIGDTGAPTVSVVFPGGSCTNLPVLHSPAGMTEERIPLTSCGLDSPADLEGLTATFSASLTPGGSTATSRLDGMWLEIASRGPTEPVPPVVRQGAGAASTTFLPANEARIIGENPAPLFAEAKMSGATESATLTVSDFNRVPLAPGSRIESAKLRVAHQEVANVAAVSVEATVPAAGGAPAATCAPAPLASATTGAFVTHEVPLDDCLEAPEQLAGLAAVYTASRSATAISATQVPATATGERGFTTADAQTNGRSIDAVPVAATLNSGTPTASVALTGYDQTPAPPPEGSTIDAATLRIAHQEDGEVGAVTATVTFQGTACPTTLTPRPGSIQVDTVDLDRCGLTSSSQLAELTVTYQADLAAGGTTASILLDGAELDISYRLPAVDRLDGIELDIVFQTPSLRPLTGPPGFNLLTVAPPTSPTVDTTTRFVAGGTIYAPSAGIDLKMYGLDTQVLRRGVVARSITLGLRGNGRPVGAIPPEVVRFTAYPDVTLTPKNITATGFSNPVGWAADRDDDISAEAVLDPGDADPLTPATGVTADVVLDDYDQTDLPDGADIDAAVLRVRHLDGANTVKVTVEVDGTVCVRDQELAARTSDFGEDQIDLGTCLAQLDDPTKLEQVLVTYVVELDPAATAQATARLNGITLEVLSGPMVRASMTFDRAKATVDGWSVTR